MTEVVNNPIRVMLVDDSAVIRGIFKRVLANERDIEVVMSASDGQMALNSLDRHDIEVIILDIEMPIMDGMTALPKLIEKKPDIQIIVASTLTRRNAEISIRALACGAKDYIPKPESSKELQTEEFQRDLLTKIRALGEAKRKKTGEVPPKVTHVAAAPTSQVKTEIKAVPQKGKLTLRKAGTTLPDIITIGSSTGGPQALSAFLKNFPKDILQPILITQHMPPTFTAILADHLGKESGIKCKEAADGDIIEQQHIYVAPGGIHMTVVSENGRKVIRLVNSAPENFCKPAVDPMLRSVAQVYGSRVLTIILTGMGQDGLRGSEIIVEKGGTVIAQDEASSVVWGMPGAVSMAGLCAAILPLNDIAYKIKEFIR